MATQTTQVPAPLAVQSEPQTTATSAELIVASKAHQIVGTSPLERGLPELAELLAQEVVALSGHVALENVWQYCVGSDLAVLLSRSEVWGLTLNEAVACGQATTASPANGATRDLLVSPQYGWIVGPSDGEQLTAAPAEVAALRGGEPRAVGEAVQEHILSKFGLQNAVDGIPEASDMVVAWKMRLAS